MFDLKIFIITNIVNGIKNGTFSKEYGNIMAVNYLAKGMLTEDDVASIDSQITEWEAEKETTSNEAIEETVPAESIGETVEETTGEAEPTETE